MASWHPDWVNWLLTDGNQLGPGTEGKEPIKPKPGSFVVRPNRWTRLFVIEQRANDYDYLDYWAADDATAPVQIYRGVPISVRKTGSIADSIDKFWLEFNASVSGYNRGNQRDLVAYVRNFAALYNPPSDVSGLLLRPGAGLPPARSSSAGPPPARVAASTPKPVVPTGPSAPTKLRIIR